MSLRHTRKRFPICLANLLIESPASNRMGIEHVHVWHTVLVGIHKALVLLHTAAAVFPNFRTLTTFGNADWAGACEAPSHLEDLLSPVVVEVVAVSREELLAFLEWCSCPQNEKIADLAGGHIGNTRMVHHVGAGPDATILDSSIGGEAVQLLGLSRLGSVARIQVVLHDLANVKDIDDGFAIDDFSLLLGLRVAVVEEMKHLRNSGRVAIELSDNALKQAALVFGEFVRVGFVVDGQVEVLVVVEHDMSGLLDHDEIAWIQVLFDVSDDATQSGVRKLTWAAKSPRP